MLAFRNYASGDVFVCVDDRCIVGLTHQQLVDLFLSIPIGNSVTVDVCRGYSLPSELCRPNGRNMFPGSVSAASMPNVNQYSHNTLQAEMIPNMSNANRSRSAQSLELSYAEGGKGYIARSFPGTVVTRMVIKGTRGFGFILINTLNGHQIKKVLDSQRCYGLHEGDLLLEVNSVSVEHRAHDDVVAMLKDLPICSEAVLCVFRPGTIQLIITCFAVLTMYYAECSSVQFIKQ